MEILAEAVGCSDWGMQPLWAGHSPKGARGGPQGLVLRDGCYVGCQLQGGCGVWGS